MPTSESIAALNRILAILMRSFPQYLRYARPFIPPGQAIAMETINEIATGQDTLAERVSDQIVAAGAIPDSGEYPMEFTDTHDLAIDYLVREAICYQRQDIEALAESAESLSLAPAAQSLAYEALGMAKGHLESLQEIADDGCASTEPETIRAFANDVPVSNQLTGEPHRQQERKLAAGDPKSPG